MKTQKYTLAALLSDRELEQFIIPEIQRDYVWETSDVNDLLSYIREGFDGGDADVPYLGFIYAYGDRDFVYKYFLIDGQQRLTTVFLMLIAGYLHVGKKIPDYLFDRGQLKLDYKVRQSTHDFLSDLVNHCYQGNLTPNFSITDQAWYHDDYQNDRSIMQMISNFMFIRSWFKGVEDVPGFIRFTEERLELSYYDIPDGRQGEDLYIYMNSRGRHLEPNETLKAKYLARVADKKYWGSEWELWQDLFWKFRLHRPDADEGFNDFLKMAQLIEMSRQGLTADVISSYARGATDQTLLPEQLPEKVEDLQKLFEAYEWLIKSTTVKDFFKKYEKEENYLLLTPPTDRAQIFYFRLLPILVFIAGTDCREEEVLIRFIRFFYNLSRKRGSIGKDIGGQFVVAIRLMQEYIRTERDVFDVCNLITYQKRRTTLIDEEEVRKLSLYEQPPTGVTRLELESLFWEVEDHKIFEGQIGFFLWHYSDTETGAYKHELFLATWAMFQKLFQEEPEGLIIMALLQYGNTWVRESPFYYVNYNCADWNGMVQTERGVHLMQLLEDLALNGWTDLDSIITKKSGEYLRKRGYNTVAAVKAETDFFKQVKLLAILDYFNDNEMFTERHYHIANDGRFSCKTYGDRPFFTNSVVIHNIKRYIDSGLNGRVIHDLTGLLKSETKVQELIDDILAAGRKRR